MYNDSAENLCYSGANIAAQSQCRNVDALLSQCCDVLLKSAEEPSPPSDAATGFGLSLKPVSLFQRDEGVMSTRSESFSQRPSGEPFAPDLTFFAKFLLNKKVFHALTVPIMHDVGSKACGDTGRNRVRFWKYPESHIFPGTDCHVLSIRSDSLEALLAAVDSIIRFMIPIGTSSGRKIIHNKQIVRLAIPRLVAGSLIGKNGETIQQLRGRVGAHIHISPLFVSSDEACSERVIQIVSKDKASVREAVKDLLILINNHPSRLLVAERLQKHISSDFRRLSFGNTKPYNSRKEILSGTSGEIWPLHLLANSGENTEIQRPPASQQQVQETPTSPAVEVPAPDVQVQHNGIRLYFMFGAFLLVAYMIRLFFICLFRALGLSTPMVLG